MDINGLNAIPLHDINGLNAIPLHERQHSSNYADYVPLLVENYR